MQNLNKIPKYFSSMIQIKTNPNLVITDIKKSFPSSMKLAKVYINIYIYIYKFKYKVLIKLVINLC